MKFQTPNYKARKHNVIHKLDSDDTLALILSTASQLDTLQVERHGRHISHGKFGWSWNFTGVTLCPGTFAAVFGGFCCLFWRQLHPGIP